MSSQTLNYQDGDVTLEEGKVSDLIFILAFMPVTKISPLNELV